MVYRDLYSSLSPDPLDKSRNLIALECGARVHRTRGWRSKLSCSNGSKISVIFLANRSHPNSKPSFRITSCRQSLVAK